MSNYYLDTCLPFYSLLPPILNYVYKCAFGTHDDPYLFVPLTELLIVSLVILYLAVFLTSQMCIGVEETLLCGATYSRGW